MKGNGMKLTLARKILLILAVPFLGLLYFSALQVANRAADLQSASAASLQTELAVQASALIFEMQKERGLSAGFISSKGQKFKEELRQQRPVTNQKIEAI